jgi:hypothetical protein
MREAGFFMIAAMFLLSLSTVQPAYSHGGETHAEDAFTVLQAVQKATHLFRIGMIFIFMGGTSLLLDGGATFRAWLIVLPFIAMLIDIAAVWLKRFVSPVFSWMHLPGGGLFGLVFGYVSLRALWEMWLKPRS